MEKEKTTRPFILEVDNVRKEIVGVINRAVQNNVPCYIIDMILSDVVSQVKAGAKNEIEAAKAKVGAAEAAPKCSCGHHDTK